VEPTKFEPRFKFKPPLKFFNFGLSLINLTLYYSPLIPKLKSFVPQWQLMFPIFLNGMLRIVWRKINTNFLIGRIKLVRGRIQKSWITSKCCSKTWDTIKSWNFNQCYEIWDSAQFEPVISSSATRFKFKKIGPNIFIFYY